MKINKEINLVELAGEISHLMLANITIQNGGFIEDLFIENEDEVFIYAEKTQDLFNEYYDEIYEFLEQKGFKHKQ